MRVRLTLKKRNEEFRPNPNSETKPVMVRCFDFPTVKTLIRSSPERVKVKERGDGFDRMIFYCLFTSIGSPSIGSGQQRRRLPETSLFFH